MKNKQSIKTTTSDLYWKVEKNAVRKSALGTVGAYQCLCSARQGGYFWDAPTLRSIKANGGIAYAAGWAFDFRPFMDELADDLRKVA